MNRVLTSIICLLSVLMSSGFAQISGETSDIANIKLKVAKFAASKKRVFVVTRSDEKAKGYITGFDDDKFMVNDHKSGQTSTFQYSKNVRRIRKSGGVSTGLIAVITVAGAGAVIILATFGRRCRNEGGCF